MKRYKFIITIETPKKLSASLLNDVCDSYIEDITGSDSIHLFGLDNEKFPTVKCNWKQDFEFIYPNGGKGIVEGKDIRKVERDLKAIGIKFTKLKEDIK